MSSSSTVLCRYFVRSGRCFNGSECKFRHAQPETNNAPANQTSTAAANANNVSNRPDAGNNAPIASSTSTAASAPSAASASISPSVSSFPTFPHSHVSQPPFPLSTFYSDFQSFQPTDTYDYSAFLVSRARYARALELDRLHPEDPEFRLLPATLDNRRYNSIMPIQDPNAAVAALQSEAMDPLHAAIQRCGVITRSFKLFDTVHRSHFHLRQLIFPSNSINNTTGNPVVIDEERAIKQTERLTAVEKASMHASSVPISSHASDSLSLALHKPKSVTGQFDSPATEIFTNPSLNPLRRVFTTKEFGPIDPSSSVSMPLAASDSSPLSICLVSDFHPLAQSIADYYFAPYCMNLHSDTSNTNTNAPILTERILWRHIADLLLLLTSIEESGLYNEIGYAFNAKKILLFPDLQLKLSGIGVYSLLKPFDSLFPSSSTQSLGFSWFLRQFRTICFQLAAVVMQLKEPLEVFDRASAADSPALQSLLSSTQLSLDLRQFLARLFDESSCDSFMALSSFITPKLMQAMQAQRIDQSQMALEMSRHSESTRLFTLLSKLLFVVSSSNASSAASAMPSLTGDHYLLDLFRASLFQSQLAQGVPNLDYHYLIDQLNKFDSGSHEKTILNSETGEDLLIVRYADLKRALQAQFEELKAKQYQAKEELQEVKKLLAEASPNAAAAGKKGKFHGHGHSHAQGHGHAPRN